MEEMTALPVLQGLSWEEGSDGPVKADGGKAENLRTVETEHKRLESEGSECPHHYSCLCPLGQVSMRVASATEHGPSCAEGGHGVLGTAFSELPSLGTESFDEEISSHPKQENASCHRRERKAASQLTKDH